MKLLVMASCLFIGSFFLPSYYIFNGYECAKFCAWDMWSFPEMTGIAYYFLFTISNLLMILVPVLLITKLKHKRIPIGLIVGQIILLGHVITWQLLDIIDDSDAEIKIGYYIWLMSMVLMLGCTLSKRKSDKNLQPTPLKTGDDAKAQSGAAELGRLHKNRETTMNKILILIIYGLSIATFADEYRSFTNKDDQIVRAKVLRVDVRAKTVTMETENKRKATIPISTLLEADQEYINNWSPTLTTDASEPTNSEDNAMPTTPTKGDVNVIAKRYVDSCNNGDADTFFSLLFSIEILKSEHYNELRSRFTSVFVQKDCLVERMAKGMVGDYFFQLKISYAPPKNTSIDGERIYWVLLTPNGRIKYGPFFTPSHPIEHLSYTIGAFHRGWSNNEYLRSLIDQLNALNVPLFGLKEGVDGDEAEEAAEEIIDWLMKNGTRLDISDPKVFYPEIAFKSIKTQLASAKNKL